MRCTTERRHFTPNLPSTLANSQMDSVTPGSPHSGAQELMQSVRCIINLTGCDNKLFIRIDHVAPVSPLALFFTGKLPIRLDRSWCSRPCLALPPIFFGNSIVKVELSSGSQTATSPVPSTQKLRRWMRVHMHILHVFLQAPACCCTYAMQLASVVLRSTTSMHYNPQLLLPSHYFMLLFQIQVSDTLH